MVRCAICGKEIHESCADPVITGRNIKYKCLECASKGNKEIQKMRADYFYHSYEGQRRLRNGEKKRRFK